MSKNGNILEKNVLDELLGWHVDWWAYVHEGREYIYVTNLPQDMAAEVSMHILENADYLLPDEYYEIFEALEALRKFAFSAGLDAYDIADTLSFIFGKGVSYIAKPLRRYDPGIGLYHS